MHDQLNLFSGLMLVKLYRYVLFMCLLCFSWGKVYALNLSKDTVSARVVYGDKKLLDGIDTLTIEEVKNIYQNLAKNNLADSNQLAQIELYIKIPDMEFNQVFSVIDSLFEMDKIPYPLINQINKYIETHELKEHKKQEIDTTQYPADFYYNSWNTKVPNPYKTNQLAKNDSTLKLSLTNSIKEDYKPPFEGVITSGFGWRNKRNHNGIDIDLEVWDSVVCAFPGMVRVARWYGAYGRVVVVRHFNGLETLYAHLHRIKVEPGQILKAGELLGLGGSSGRSSGSHLHWEIRFKGVPLNPAHFIDLKDFSLEDDTLVLKRTKYGFAAFPFGTKFHEVKKGEFLYKIAQHYGTTVKKLCRLNGIRRNSILFVGQKLRVI